MNRHKDISIRKFSLLALIGLALLILSNIFITLNISNEKVKDILMLVSQVLGNLFLGIGLIGYFLHLKQNRLLKWTSLFVGIFYILNLMAPNSLLPYVLEEFQGVSENLILVYTIAIECIMIFFGISFIKLSSYSRWVGLFCILFVSFASITFAFDLINITIQYNYQLENFLIEQGYSSNRLEDVSSICKILSHASLLLVFAFLFVRQKNQLNTVFNIKDLSTPDPKELKKIEKELKVLEKAHENELKKES